MLISASTASTLDEPIGADPGAAGDNLGELFVRSPWGAVADVVDEKERGRFLSNSRNRLRVVNNPPVTRPPARALPPPSPPATEGFHGLPPSALRDTQCRCLKVVRIKTSLNLS